MNHTPLPWISEKCDDVDLENFPLCPESRRLVGSDMISPGFIFDDYSGLAQVNAAFIVEACNNYERLQQENKRLRELLVEVERFLKCTMDGHGRSWTDLTGSAIKARQALGESCD